jgi:hypothetical protein
MRLHHDLGPDITDAALVSAAYAKWGLDSITRLIGDWSLAIWDGSSRRVVLARDYMGNRPLFYLELPCGLAWATSLDGLADAFDLYGKPDEDWLAGKLTYGVPPDITPFRGARALRSGHLLIATPHESPHIRRYWTFKPARVRYDSLQDYADQAREHLTEAVRVRLRAKGRVWSHLSGGFDSSSIVCLANTLITRRCVEASALQPVSRVSRNSPESDESDFIHAVERWCGLTSIKLDPEGPPSTFQELLARKRPFVDGTVPPLEAPMVAAGDRVLFSGEVGDLVMIRGSAQIVSLLERLHEGHPIEFLKMCLARARQRHNQVVPLLVKLAIKGYFRRRVSHRRDRPPSRQLLPTGALSEPAVADRVTPALLARAPALSFDYPDVSDFPVAKRVLIGALYQFTDHQATSNSDAFPGVWKTFPFTHRPLVELMIGVPQLAFWDVAISRAGMKRALADVLPPELLARGSKGDPRVASSRHRLAIAEEYARTSLPPEPPQEWQLVKDGYLRLDALVNALNSVSERLPPSRFLRQSVNLEAWLRRTHNERTHSPMRDAAA